MPQRSINRQRIKAVIFDCDGTLVDSETISLQVMVDFVADLGVTLSHTEALSRFAGKDLKLVIDELAPLMNRPVPEDFISLFRVQQLAALRSDLKPIEGADELISSMQLPFCVASNAPLSKVQVCLDSTGLAKHFSDRNMFSAYQVQAWKPDPAVFLYAAAQTGVKADECLVVEDSIFGVDAGINAKMQVIAFDPDGQLSDQIDQATNDTNRAGYAQVQFISHLDEAKELLT